MFVGARFSSAAKACAHVVGAGMLYLLRMCWVSPSANELRELLSASHAARSNRLSITGTKDAARTASTASTPTSSISEKARRELFFSQFIQVITFYDALLPDTPHQTDNRQIDGERDGAHDKNQQQ